MNMQPNSVPQAVLEAYFDTPPRAIKVLDGGVINRTFLLIDHRGQKFILQHMSSLFNDHTVEDFKVVSKHLAAIGWPMQQVIQTKRHASTIHDASGIWRLLSYIEGQEAPEIMSEAQLFEVGALLAKLHNDLRSLQYRPHFILPNFHDTSFYKANLQSVKADLPSQLLSQLADDCLLANETITMPPARNQLIHGDPRTTNILFNENLPITYIDFDTLMLGSPWIDIGDILRSINGSKDQTIQKFSLNSTLALARGYYSQNTFDLAFDEFFSGALASMQIICIELTMRFVTDVVHDSYFGWDAALFGSRRENNIARALAQWEIYKKAGLVS